MEGLIELINHPKLEDGKYFDLINILVKKIEDPNIVVFRLVLEALFKLAKGLGNSFGQYKHIVMPSLIVRMKETKLNLVEELRKTIDSVYHSVTVI
jgi:cytoskeleton-associated protein 5